MGASTFGPNNYVRWDVKIGNGYLDRDRSLKSTGVEIKKKIARGRKKM